MKSVFLIALASFLTIACTQQPPPTKESAVASPPASATPSETAVAKVPGFRDEWTSAIFKFLDSRRLAQFNAAQVDMAARFCPKYLGLSADGQRLAWAHLMSAIVARESGLDSKTGFYKVGSAMTESTGAVSQGLFQLTYGDSHCPKKKSDGDLNDPLVNIDCAMQLMADFLVEDKVIAAGGYPKYGAPPPKGLARYWSVLRVPDSKSSHYLSEIQSKTKRAPNCQ